MLVGGWWACFVGVLGWLVCLWVGWFVGSDCHSVGLSVGCFVGLIVGC